MQAANLSINHRDLSPLAGSFGLFPGKKASIHGEQTDDGCGVESREDAEGRQKGRWSHGIRSSAAFGLSAWLTRSHARII